MEETFWINRWQTHSTPWHQQVINPQLTQHITPEMLKGQRVLVPLCGKSYDLIWLSQHADHVIGIELVEKAIKEFFTEQDLSYTQPNPTQYTSHNITIHNRNIFDTTAELIGPIDLVYDRAALIALNADLCQRYTKHIDSLLNSGAQQLIITLEYEPQADSPPFSVTPNNIQDYYGKTYHIELLESTENPQFPGRDLIQERGLTFLTEHVWKLTKL